MRITYQIKRKIVKPNGDKKSITTKLIIITTIVLKLQVDDIVENLPRYYMDMLQIHVVTNLKTTIAWQQI
jgi:hypothetical protein